MHNRLPIRYEVTTYRGLGTEPEVRSMNPDEVEAVDLKCYDHVIWPSRNLLAYRAADGEWIEKPLEGSGLGDVCLGVLECAQINPGLFVTCGEIAMLTGNENLYGSNALSARVRVIRRAHGDSPRNPRFLVSRRKDFALMWPIARSWARIDLIKPEPTTDAA